MSDEYKFDVDDVGQDEENEMVETEELGVGDTLKEGLSSTNLVLLPFIIFAVYAFLEKVVVVGALTSLFGGAEGLAVAIATAAWVAGGVIIAGIGLVVVAVVVLILTGLIQRSGAKLVLGLVGAIYLAVGYLGATYLFGYVPLLVGFMLTTTLVVWGVVFLLGAIGIIAAAVIA